MIYPTNPAVALFVELDFLELNFSSPCFFAHSASFKSIGLPQTSVTNHVLQITIAITFKMIGFFFIYKTLSTIGRIIVIRVVILLRN